MWLCDRSLQNLGERIWPDEVILVGRFAQLTEDFAVA
jgi:hypothetical protein